MNSHHGSDVPSDGNSRVSLGGADIHLWAVFCDQITDEQLLGRYRDILSAPEREQELRYHFARDRRRYVITRALVRTVLSRYCGLPPAEWSFAPNAYGRPQVTNSGVAPEALRFNVSHTNKVILLGVTCSGDLGVDIEDVSKSVSPVEIAQRFFAAREYDDLKRHDGEAQKRRFFEYWTLKEAYVKARGMGLSIPLDSFGFHFPSNREIAVTFDESLSESEHAWRFWLLRPESQHLAAICAGRGSESAQQISLRATIPLIGDHPLPDSTVRRSE